MTSKSNSHLPSEHQALRKPIFKPKDRLAAYRAFYEAGIPMALLDALNLCIEVGGQTPPWVLKASFAVIVERTREGRSVGRGRHGNDAKAMQENAVHLTRYLHVQAARDRGDSLADAYATAAQTLGAVNLAASEDTIRNSYKKVQKALKTPETALKFYPLPPYRLHDEG